MHNSSALSHPWLHRGRLTCMPLHSAANYFPLRETTAVLTLKYWHIQQQRLKNISPLHLHTPWGKGKNATSSVRLWKSTYFNQTRTDSPKGFYDRCVKGCNYFYSSFPLCCCWGPEVRHEVEVAQKRSSDTRDDDRRKSSLRPKSCSLLCSCITCENRVQINLIEAWIPTHIKSTFSTFHCKHFKTLPGGKRHAAICHCSAPLPLRRIQRSSKSAWLIIKTISFLKCNDHTLFFFFFACAAFLFSVLPEGHPGRCKNSNPHTPSTI